MKRRAAIPAIEPGWERAKTRSLHRETELFDYQRPFGMAGGTMAWGENRVFSPFFLAGRLVRGATGLSRSGGEGR
ncbi:MAG: hypothetical protein K0S78_556 [Thermomicrobiales bacterium]|jgi:hypothetical protein|nr:hypothetical protein [Thermomicrobiales bacterium]